jgi:glutathione S-transferase
MEEEIIYESQIVSQFLCDAFPSHLLPSSHEDPTAALRRARIGFFVDTWGTKLGTFQFGVMKAAKEDKQAEVDKWVSTIEKEIEPLLKDAGPFFGGSKELTFADAMVAPFLLRWYLAAEHNKYIPSTLIKGLEKLENFAKWSKAVREHPSVLEIWEPEAMTKLPKKYEHLVVAMD